MTRAIPAGAALALLASALPAQAFVRSTTVQNQPGQGLCLFWNTRQVTFKVNATSARAPACGNAGTAAALAVASFPAWTPSCTDFRFVNGGATTGTAVANDCENRVIFRSGYCPDLGCSGNTCATNNNCWDHGQSGTLALTTTTYIVSTGEIVDADMELNGWNGVLLGSGSAPRGAYLTCVEPPASTCQRDNYGQTGCIYYDVGNIVTHEAGHMLGLDHTCTYPAPYDSCPTGGTTMNPTMLPGETSKRVLTPDDKNGVCTVYPLGAPTATCGPAPSGGNACAAPAPTKSGGCSTAGGGAGAMGLLSLAALLLRRRRA